MQVLVNVNGQIGSPEEVKVSVLDRGFLFGDGVYETGRSYEGCFLYLEEHLSRIRRSAEKLFLPVPWKDKELKGRLFETARVFKKKDQYFRIIITRGPIHAVGLDIKAEKPTLVMIIQDVPASMEECYTKGVHLITSKVIRNSPLAQDPNIKTSNYLNSFLALQDAKQQSGDDAVMCDREGNVTEGTTFSIFGVTKEKTLMTSSLEVGILESITRGHVLELARKTLRVEEGFFKLSQFQQCSEAFMASSVREVTPVRKWDSHTYPTPGPVTKILQQMLKEDIHSYVEGHDKF